MVVLHDEIDLEDMDMATDVTHTSCQQNQLPQHELVEQHECQQVDQHVQLQQQVYSYPCRCGDRYVLFETDLGLSDQEIIVPCR